MSKYKFYIQRQVWEINDITIEGEDHIDAKNKAQAWIDAENDGEACDANFHSCWLTTEEATDMELTGNFDEVPEILAWKR